RPPRLLRHDHGSNYRGKADGGDDQRSVEGHGSSAKSPGIALLSRRPFCQHGGRKGQITGNAASRLLRAFSCTHLACLGATTSAAMRSHSVSVKSGVGCSMVVEPTSQKMTSVKGSIH